MELTEKYPGLEMGMGNFRKARKPSTKALAAKKSERVHETTAQGFEKASNKVVAKGLLSSPGKASMPQIFPVHADPGGTVKVGYYTDLTLSVLTFTIHTSVSSLHPFSLKALGGQHT